VTAAFAHPVFCYYPLSFREIFIPNISSANVPSRQAKLKQAKAVIFVVDAVTFAENASEAAK